jgi:hypothetical protein
VVSFIFFSQTTHSPSDVTDIGQAAYSIRFAKYDVFANGRDTETGLKTSCISSVVYGLRKVGFECDYKDFKAYYSHFSKQASILELGKTKISNKGLILFNRTHFAILFSDKNHNKVIDINDQIIHAYFRQLDVGSLADWLNNDPIRPIYYVDLENGVSCPN